VRFNYLVVVGASAGGIEALRTLVGALPPEFPAPICVVTHTSPESPGVLDAILSRAGPLPAINVRDANRLEPGRIYVAPPDYHLLVEPGRVRVTKGPRENGFRPAIDPLFRSAAQVYGPRTIGIILTGNLDDGTAGLWAVKQLGGVAIVQDPADASFPEMPTNAMQHAKVDHVVPIAALAPLLVRLTTQAAPEEPAEAVPEHLEVEVKISGENNPYEAGLEKLGTPSSYACPDCHGVLLQLREGERVRFRCHTGHAYSIVSLLAAVGEGIEDAMWNAIRSLEEAALLMERIAEHMRTSHGAAGAANLVERGDETRRQADEIRKLVMQREPLPTPDN
jgi:two-component system, chemotaxis family, protein-glutamate methylesterase/glutaminase